MPRPTKRDQVISAAVDLFQNEGFQAIGVSRIREHAEVSRMTLYNHFHSKDELILASLEVLHMKWMSSIVDRAEAHDDLREAVLSVFDALSAWFEDPSFRGCLFTSAACEFRDPSSTIHAMAARHKATLEHFLTAICIDLDASDPEVLGSQLAMLVEGAIVQASVLGRPEAADVARAAAEILLDSSLAPSPVP